MPARRSGAARRAAETQAPEPERRRDAILDATLELARERGWNAIHLRDVADRLGISLTEIGRLFPDKDAVGNRLFARATAAMLALSDDAGFRTLPTGERLYRAITAWLDALAPHRAAARAVLFYKFAPAHLHLQAALLTALSRTVQWLREAAGLTGAGRARRQEEVRLTLLFATTLLGWLADGSPNQARTRACLRRRLMGAAAGKNGPRAERRARTKRRPS